MKDHKITSHSACQSTPLSRCLLLVLIPGLLALGLSSSCFAGAYIFAGEANGVDAVTHPSGYSGTGGVLTVGICISPASVNSAQMEISVQNIVNTFNSQTVSTGNLLRGANNNIPANFYDFESVTLHEVGHCIGLAHVNASSESGLTGVDANYTKATNGANNVFNINPGPDGIIGSSDDLRGDDLNLHWFNNFANNPFIIDSIVDSTTYSRSTANLPAGHNFATNADRSVSTLLGVPDTESIMQQGTGSDESQRTLVADDVATLKYAMSGLDEMAGTADDYTLNLVYRGITTTNCDVTISFDNAASFAFCQPAGVRVNGGSHYRITSATIALNDTFNWFFNNVPNVTTDTMPNAFTFVDQPNVSLNTLVTSTSITVSGINAPASISVSGGQYSINGGAFTSIAGSVNNADLVRVQHTSSILSSTVTNTTLSIGGVSDIFSSTTLASDTTPNFFAFTDQTNVALNTQVTSNTITVQGINAATAISVTGGQYNINGGAFTSVAGMVNNTDTVSVRHTSSTLSATVTNTALSIGGVSDTFSSTTLASDTTPNPFAFTDQTNVALNTQVTSNTITVQGINAPAAISVTGGQYNINGGAFTSVVGTVSNADTVSVRHTSSTLSSTVTNTALSIGGVSDTFSSTTLASDTTPNPFAFTDQTNVALSTLVTSNNVSVLGVNAAASISVTGGQYSINNGAFTSLAGTVNNNDLVRVQHTSSGSFATLTNTVLSIGGVSDTFTSTTLTSDTTPNAFAFTDQTGVTLSTLMTSNNISVLGVNAVAPISVTGGQYSINNGAFTSLTGTVNNNDLVRVQHTSSGSFSTLTNTVLSIGGVSDTFSSTTLASDITPNTFAFIDQTEVALNSSIISNSVTITGINSVTSITVNSGEYSVNGGLFTTVAGIVNNSDTVRVRHTSPSTAASVTNTTLTIGGVSDIFSSTTLTSVIDTTPDVFVFPDLTNVALNALITSDSITVTGINSAATISIAGGQYSINGGAFSAITATVNSGDTVVVQHTSSANFFTPVETTLTIGGVSDVFTSTTISEDMTPDTFTFVDQADVALNTPVSSNPVTVSGINSPTAITVIGGEYQVNSAVFTAVAGTVNDGDIVIVRHTSSSTAATVTDTTLTIGGVSDVFSSTTIGGDTSPDVFTFVDQTDVALNTPVSSNRITISGINSPTTISVSSGEYQINTGTFTAVAGTVNAGDSVVVRHTSSATVATATDTTLTIGGVSDVFTSTTLAEDTTPDAFTFVDQADVALNSLISSNRITITGISSPTAISVSSGEYQINSAAFTALAGTVNAGDSVVVRHTSSAAVATATDTTLTIGGVTDVFTSTTLGGDTTPDAFTFADQLSVALSTLVTSEAITVSGINSSAAISVTGGMYSINGGAFTLTAGTVNNGDVLRAQHISSASPATVTNTVLTIGGVSDGFSSTTMASDTTPDIFAFVDQTDVQLNAVIISNTILVSGINSPAAISVSGGQYSINGGALTSVAGMINNGDTVTVQHSSAASFSTVVNTTLTIGSVSDIFSSTTVAVNPPPPPAVDTTPDTFIFADQTDVALSISVSSARITISGINSAAAISVSGGEYQINSGAFTALAGMVNNGDTVIVRHTTATAAATVTSTTLTIGGVSDIFSSTTAGADPSPPPPPPPSGDTTPDEFTFTDQMDVELNALVSSSSIMVTGIDSSAAIVISGGSYSINGGEFTSAAGIVNNGDTVVVQHMSSEEHATQTNTRLSIAGAFDIFTDAAVSDTFTSTTIIDANDPGGAGATGPLMWLMLLATSLFRVQRRKRHQASA
jgi:uncharacterized protein (DUF1330 family)